MRTKCITFLALVLVMGAFLLPINALALINGDTSDEPPEVQEIPLFPTLMEEPPPPTPTPEPPQSPWADAPDTGNPFTPGGVATVVDNATSDDGKEFFTFQTPEGNVFFLVIDRSRGQDNVYFLNAVTEQDLLALAVSSDDTPLVPAPEPLPIPEVDVMPEEPEIPTAPEPESTMAQPSSLRLQSSRSAGPLTI